MKSKFLSHILLGCLLGACSYTLNRGATGLGGVKAGDQAQKVFIPLVDNTTPYTGFEAVLTTALRETLVQSKDLDVVNKPEDAKYLLLANVTGFNRHRTSSIVTGNGGSQAAGGIADKRITAGEIGIDMSLTIRLVENVPSSTGPAIQRLVWSRNFFSTANYPTSRRFLPASDSLDGGSSSAPHINMSREKVQLQTLSRKIAQLVLDQVVQDF